MVTPNIMQPISGFSDLTSSGGAVAMPDHRPGGVVEHLPRDLVEPHLGDRVHHGDVFGAHVRAHIPGSHGREQQLGNADGQALHDARGPMLVPIEPANAIIP